MRNCRKCEEEAEAFRQLFSGEERAFLWSAALSAAGQCATDIRTGGPTAAASQVVLSAGLGALVKLIRANNEDARVNRLHELHRAGIVLDLSCTTDNQQIH